MKWSVLFCAVLLAGCNHIPSKPDWPAAPDVGVCPELSDAIPSEKISQLLATVTLNYGEYHKCKARTEAWQQWYDKQKKIYEDAK